MTRMVLFYILQFSGLILQMAGLIKDIWFLISASTINLSQYVVLTEVYEENLAAHRFFFFFLIWKREEDFNSLLGSLWIFKNFAVWNLKPY